MSFEWCTCETHLRQPCKDGMTCSACGYPINPDHYEEDSAMPSQIDIVQNHETALRWARTCGADPRTVRRMACLVQDTKLPMNLRLTIMLDTRGYFYLQVGDPSGVCNVTGLPLPWTGRKWLLSEHMTDGEVVQTAFLAVKVAMEHELRETFLFKGQPILDPHYNLDHLVELRARPDAILERK